jgi:hypothetical protein
MNYSHGWMADTDPAFLRKFLDRNHGMPAEQKYQLVLEMHETLKATYLAQERHLRPEASEREIFLRAAARRLGKDLVQQAYGWAPDE